MAISILANSSNGTFQMSAILALSEFLEIGKIDVKVLEPLLQLLKSSNIEVETLALTALNRFAEDEDNARLVVQCGALNLLIDWMRSSSASDEVRHLLCRCVFFLPNKNKNIIARSGALVPLLYLAQSENAEVQQGAVATFRELVQLEDNIQMVIDAGAVPVMLKLLKSSDKEVRLSSAETLYQFGFDLENLHKSDTTASELIHSIITLSNSDDIRGKQQVALAFAVIINEECFRDEIVQHGGLESLRGLLMLTDLTIVPGPLFCIDTISEHAKHQARLINGGFLDRLIELLECTDENIQIPAASTLFNLASNSEFGRTAVANSNVVERIRVLVPNSLPKVQTFMVMITSTLINNDILRQQLMPLGVIDIFIHCTTSSSESTRRRAVDAICEVALDLSDHQPLVKAWGTPAGGIHSLLLRLLEDPDEESRMRGLGIILSMLHSTTGKVVDVVKNAGKLKAALRQIAQLPKNTTTGRPTKKMRGLSGDTAFNVQAARKILHVMKEGEP